MKSGWGVSNSEGALFVSFQCNGLNGRALIPADHKNSDRRVLASWASSEPVLFLPVRSSMAFPRPPQLAASLNNAIPISTPILHSNSCLLVFPSPSLFLAVWHIARMENTALLTQASALLKYGGAKPFCFRWAFQRQSERAPTGERRANRDWN